MTLVKVGNRGVKESDVDLEKCFYSSFPQKQGDCVLMWVIVTVACAGSHQVCGRVGRRMDEGGNLLADPCARYIQYSWYNYHRIIE